MRDLRSTTLLAIAFVSACACGTHNASRPTTSLRDGGDLDGASDAALDSGDAGIDLHAWIEDVRVERWADAAKAIDRLPESERDRPEVKYARARAAMGIGKFAEAATLLEGLETDLPLLRPTIAKRRAESQLEAGAYVQGAEYFALGWTPGDQLRAAEGFEKAGDAVRARAACDHVVTMAGRTSSQEAKAREIRMRILDAKRDKAGGASDWQTTAAHDARWIAVHTPELAAVKAADALLAKLDPSNPLTSDEWMERARLLADAADANGAIAAIRRATSAPGSQITPSARARATGYAYFKSHTHYDDAAKELNAAALAGGPHAAEDAFYAARSLERADDDDRALVQMRAVEKRYPRTTWADQASFHAARIHVLHGEWREAASAFDLHAKRYPSGKDRAEAARYGAIAHLMAGDFAVARRRFEEIAADESDWLESSRALTMAALASYKDGDKGHAIARWREIATSHPLSWPALVSRARLEQVGAELPPAIESAPPAPANAIARAPLEVKLPPPVDLLHDVGLDGDAEDALRARESIVSGPAGGRGTEAVCAAYGAIGRAHRLHQLAPTVSSALLAHAPDAANTWAWQCVYPTPYASAVDRAQTEGGLPHGLVYAVMRQESGYDPDVVSPARAVGLLQLMPDTAKAIATEAGIPADESLLKSPPYNITLGSKYLATLLARFHGAAPLAIAAYNAGPEAIERWAGRAPGMDLDVFVERIPYEETRVYVARVMGNLARYAYLADQKAPSIQLTLEAKPL